jgi:hypothetical protein
MSRFLAVALLALVLCATVAQAADKVRRMEGASLLGR